MNMTGFASLQTPRDLLGKLDRDINRLNADPADVYAAYDCFVTAYHLLDWKFPDTVPDSRASRAALIQQEPLLNIVGHLANGAKHFEATRWDRVRDLVQIGTDYWPKGHWPSDYWPDGHWPRRRLSIVLTATEAASFKAPALDALQTARKLSAFWARHV